jgi:hypothetical protein
MRSRDETQERDLNLLLDYIDQEAGASDAAARANILRRRNILYTDRKDLRRIYNYLDLLGTPVGTLRNFTRQIRERDIISRRFINVLLDQMDAGFYVGEYEQAVLADGVTSFFKMQDDEPATWTDSGPDALGDMTEDGAGLAQALGLGPFVGSNAFDDTTWAQTSALLDPGWAAGEEGTFEIWINPAAGSERSIFTSGSGGEGPDFHIEANDTLQIELFQEAALPDPGIWTVDTLYAQGDRVTRVIDVGDFMEAEVGGTSDASTEPTWAIDGVTVTDGADVAGAQAVDFGGAVIGGTGTGLANDATLHEATVDIDGTGAQPISFAGSDAQDFDALIVQLDLDTTGGAWTIIGGDLVCTSTVAGSGTSVAIVDGVLSAGTQAVDFGGAITGPTATGLTDGATTYDANVTVDGGLDVIQIIGSTSQDFDELIIALDLQTTGGTWSIIGGDLVCTSATTGDLSTILIVDGPPVGDELLWSSITNFVAILTAVDGTNDLFGRITNFDSILTAVDGVDQITWRSNGGRVGFSNLSTNNVHDASLVSAALTVDSWVHIVVVRSVDSFALWIDGVLEDEFIYPLANTDPGTFGTPRVFDFAVADYSSLSAHQIGVFSSSFAFTGLMAYAAFYRDVALTQAQIENHYAIAVGIGLQ